MSYTIKNWVNHELGIQSKRTATNKEYELAIDELHIRHNIDYIGPIYVKELIEIILDSRINPEYSL